MLIYKYSVVDKKSKLKTEMIFLISVLVLITDVGFFRSRFWNRITVNIFFDYSFSFKYRY